MKQRLPAILPVALYTLLALLMTYPLVVRMDTAVADTGDPLLNSWILAWDVHILRENPARLFDANIFFPHARTLAYSEHMLANALLGMPFLLSGIELIAVYNILFLLTFVLSAWGVYLLVKQLTGNWPAALASGTIFAFNPFRFDHISHLQILSAQWIPFIFLFLHRYSRDQRKRDLACFTLFFLIQAYTCMYISMFTTVAVCLYIVYGLVSVRRLRTVPHILQLALSATIIAAIILPMVIPYLIVQGEMGFERSIVVTKHYSAQLQNYLAYPSTNRLLGPVTGLFRSSEGALCPGFIGFVLALYALARTFRVRARRSRHMKSKPVASSARNPETENGRFDATTRFIRKFHTPFTILCLFFAALTAGIMIFDDLSFTLGDLHVGLGRLQNPIGFCLFFGIASVLTRRGRQRAWMLGLRDRILQDDPLFFYAILAVVAFLLSLGPTVKLFDSEIIAGPYQLLFDHAPGFKGIRVPARFAILVAFAISVLAGYALTRAMRTLKPAVATGIAALCIILVCVENWSLPIDYTDIEPEPPACYQWLAQQEGSFPILELPMHTRTPHPHRDAAYVYHSVSHWKSLVNGYSGFTPPSAKPISLIMDTFPSHESLELLRRLGVRYVLLHHGLAPDSRVNGQIAEIVDWEAEMQQVFSSENDVVVQVMEKPVQQFRSIPHRRISRHGWQASSSLNPAKAHQAIDEDVTTRWTSQEPAPAGTHFTLDLGDQRPVSAVELDFGSSRRDYVIDPEIDISIDGNEWQRLDEHRGRVDFALECIKNPTTATMRFYFDAHSTRYIRITERKSHARHWWSIAEVRVFGPPA